MDLLFLFFGRRWDQQLIGKSVLMDYSPLAWGWSWCDSCWWSRSVPLLHVLEGCERVRQREMWFMQPHSGKRRQTKWLLRRRKESERDGGEDRGTEEWERKRKREKDGRPSESGEVLKRSDTGQTISPGFCYLCLFCSRCPEGAGQGKSWPSVNTPAWKPLSGPDWLVLAEISSSPPPPPSPAWADAFFVVVVHWLSLNLAGSRLYFFSSVSWLLVKSESNMSGSIFENMWLYIAWIVLLLCYYFIHSHILCIHTM